MVMYFVQGLGISLADGSDLQKVTTYLTELYKIKVDDQLIVLEVVVIVCLKIKSKYT